MTENIILCAKAQKVFPFAILSIIFQIFVIKMQIREKLNLLNQALEALKCFVIAEKQFRKTCKLRDYPPKEGDAISNAYDKASRVLKQAYKL